MPHRLPDLNDEGSSIFFGMSPAISSVITKALMLPPRQRMALAALLLDSLDAEMPTDETLLRELNKRATELRSGKVEGLTTELAYGFSL